MKHFEVQFIHAYPIPKKEHEYRYVMDTLLRHYRLFGSALDSVRMNPTEEVDKSAASGAGRRPVAVLQSCMFVCSKSEK